MSKSRKWWKWWRAVHFRNFIGASQFQDQEEWVPPLPRRHRVNGGRSDHGGKGRGKHNYRWHLKRWKSRVERKRLRLDPEYEPQYNRYRGWG